LAILPNLPNQTCKIIAYSMVVNSGFFLLGFVSSNKETFLLMFLYLIIYLLLCLVFFVSDKYTVCF